jgi:hypothetical protein
LNTSKYFFAIVFLFGLLGKSNAQGNIDSLLCTLNNKDVRTVIMMAARPMYIKDESGIFIRTGYVMSSIERWLDRSIKLNLSEMCRNKFLLVNKLIELLNDPDRDFFADFLLYGVTHKISDLLSCATRDEWFKTKKLHFDITVRDYDIQMWKKYSVCMAVFNKCWYGYII